MFSVFIYCYNLFVYVYCIFFCLYLWFMYVFIDDMNQRQIQISRIINKQKRIGKIHKKCGH